MRYRAAGRGMPLVLVHGLGVSADYWVRNAAIIASAGFRVLAPDLPGFGRTPGPERGLTVEQQAIALRRWAKELGVGPAVYLGHSLSCQTILQLAADHPDDVLGLVLVAPTGKGRSMLRLAEQALGLVRDLHRESLKLAALVAQAYLRAGPGRIWRTWRMGARHDPVSLLPRVRAPGLVILGEDDPVVDPEFAHELAAGLVDGEVLMVAGGSHGVIFDETGAFNGGVIRFLQRVGARRDA